MRRIESGLLLLLALALAAASFVPSSPTSAPGFPLHGSAVNFNLNYSDPASDVFQMWTSNASHVTNAAGYWLMSPDPGSVNLIRLSSSATGTDVTVFLKVQTTISVQANVSYAYRLYTRADNATHYIVTFSNGVTSMVTNHTGSQTWNLTSGTQVGTQGWLSVTVGKTDLGGTANITDWNIDATTKMVAGNYTYEDFVWQQPGNPGSAPAFLQGRVTDSANGAGLSGVNVSTGTGGYFTATNATGYYSLPASPGNFTLTFSLAGYDSVSRTVSVNYQQTQTVNAQLSKAQPPLTEQPLFWAALIAGIAIVGVVALVALRRRRRKPAPQPPK